MQAVEEADVVVIGGGSAAHEAAIAAKDAGAGRVVMLEKAPEAQSGGNARFSGTGFRWAFADVREIQEITGLSDEEFAKYVVEPYTEERFLEDLLRVTRGRIDPELARTLVGDSNGAIRWSKEMGLRWQTHTATEIDGREHLHRGVEIHPLNLGGGMTNGLSQLVQWDAIAERVGVEKRHDSKVIGILGTERGVEGVRVSSPEREYEMRAPAVIACSGGFQANPQMRAQYLGANADLMKVRGSRHNTGEVLRMLLDLGAKPGGHWQSGHASPIDASAPDVESGSAANRYTYPYCITVDERAQRFFDEGESFTSYTYAKTGWAIQRHPGGRAFQIGDLQTWEQTPTHPAWHRPDTAVWADTLEELATLVGLDPHALRATITAFDAAIDDTSPFDPTRLDGRRTRGLTPDKSNWARALDRPPYWCIEVTGGLTFTYGGVTINPDAQVVTTNGAPIPGLYASGDILGLFFHNYPAMTGQTRNLVFGRRAGRHAAAFAAASPKPVPGR